MELTIFSAKETELIQGCRRGDRHAQQRLFDLYSGRMYGICLRYVKNPMEAEDVVVIAFTKVFERIDQFRSEGSFEGWIRRIAVNEALTHLRRKLLKQENLIMPKNFRAAAIIDVADRAFVHFQGLCHVHFRGGGATDVNFSVIRGQLISAQL